MSDIKHIAFSIDYGVLPGYVMVIINEDPTDGVKREMKHAEKKGQPGWAQFLSILLKEEIDHIPWGHVKRRLVNDVWYSAMIIKKFDITSPNDHAALAHECVHLCQFHLPDFFDRNMEVEFEAYTHTHLMKQFYSKILEP